MRAQAQGTSSAANSDGSAARGSVFGRVRNATRASSPNSNGSGAPSHRRARLSLLALAIAALALLALAPLTQAKQITGYIGTDAATRDFGGGRHAGEFDTAPAPSPSTTRATARRARATSTPSNDNNNRIQRFDRKGRFVSLWGKDVIASSVDEAQRLIVEASSGTYLLTVDGVTSPPIPFDADVDQLDDIIGALSSVGGAGNVLVSRSTDFGGFAEPPQPMYNLASQNALAATDLPQITVDAGQLDRHG